MQLPGLRYYNPQLGRWVSRDPIGESGGRNLFVILFNNAITGVDSFGLDGNWPPGTDPDPCWGFTCPGFPEPPTDGGCDLPEWLDPFAFLLTYLLNGGGLTVVVPFNDVDPGIDLPWFGAFDARNNEDVASVCESGQEEHIQQTLVHDVGGGFGQLDFHLDARVTKTGCFWNLDGSITVLDNWYNFDGHPFDWFPPWPGRRPDQECAVRFMELLHNLLSLGNPFLVTFEGEKDVTAGGKCPCCTE